MGGNVDVVELGKRQLRENGIAMVAVVIDGVLAVGIVLPDGVGEKFKLIAFRPAIYGLSVAMILPDDFLQKAYIAAGITKILANAFQSEAAIPHGKAFMNIQCEDLEITHEQD